MKYIKRIFHYFFQAPTHITPINKRALLLGVLLLILAGSRIYYNIYDYMDIVYGDEVIYMKTGLNITQDFNRDWGPLYCIWYKFISFFFHDTITLYYFNFVFVAILASLLIYAAFLAMDIHPLVAFYFALCFISSKAVVPMWPRISLFAISILMAGIIVVSRIRELYLRLLIFCLTLLLASYARPELYLSFILSVLIFITYYFAERIYQKKYSLYHLILFVLTSVLLHIIFRFPSNFYNGYPRNLAAFYQHYMVNMFYLNKATEYDWIYWKDAHKAIFTNSNSIFDIILHYPHEFFTHVGLNLKNYILEIFGKNICVIFPFLLGKNKLFLSGSLLVFAGSVSLLFNKHIRRELKGDSAESCILSGNAGHLGHTYHHLLHCHFSEGTLYHAELFPVHHPLVFTAYADCKPTESVKILEIYGRVGDDPHSVVIIRQELPVLSYRPEEKQHVLAKGAGAYQEQASE